jgi:hypothetical protein
VTEGYFNGVDGTPLQDRFAEGVILSALEWGPKAVADGGDIVTGAATVILAAGAGRSAGMAIEKYRKDGEWWDPNALPPPPAAAPAAPAAKQHKPPSPCEGGGQGGGGTVHASPPPATSRGRALLSLTFAFNRRKIRPSNGAAR